MKPIRASINIFLICFVLFLCTSYVKAQNDSVGLPYPQMLFNTPENFDETVEYSAENRSFTFPGAVGPSGKSKQITISLSSESMYSLRRKENLLKEWFEKRKTIISDKCDNFNSMFDRFMNVKSD